MHATVTARKGLRQFDLFAGFSVKAALAHKPSQWMGGTHDVHLETKWNGIFCLDFIFCFEFATHRPDNDWSGEKKHKKKKQQHYFQSSQCYMYYSIKYGLNRYRLHFKDKSNLAPVTQNNKQSYVGKIILSSLSLAKSGHIYLEGH